MQRGRPNRGSQGEAPRPKLWRAADGSLRSAAPGADSGPDIGDIWAEGERIKLAESIAEDRKQALKAQNKHNFKSWLRRKKVKVASADVKAHGPAAPAAGKSADGGTKEIAVTISLPRLQGVKKPDFSRLKARVGRLPKKKRLALAVGAPLALAALIASFSVYGGSKPSHGGQDGKQAGGSTGQVQSGSIDKSQRPKYDTVLPQGKSIDDLGGWARVSPPDKDPVFAFADTVEGVPVTVSEQPLPNRFKDDPREISKLAEQFSAKELITVDTVTAYLGTSEKGPQSLIFTKEELLILVKSSRKISNDAWAAYIASLR